MRKLVSIQTLLWLALALALAGSLRHVAHTFTSIDGNGVWGLVQAVAIDVGLFALALGITQRRRVDRPSGWLWAGVVVFTAISVYANLAYGLAFTLETLPGWVTVSKPYVLAGALPVLVLYLAEIVGGDIGQRQGDTPDTRSGVVDTLLSFYADNPSATQAQAGAAVSRSRQWVSAQLAQLEQSGVIARNGKGVVVNETTSQ